MTMLGDNLFVTGEAPPALEIRPTGEVVGMRQSGGPISHVVARGKQVFIGYTNGRVGRIREGMTEAQNVWEGRPINTGVFLAEVPERTSAR